MRTLLGIVVAVILAVGLSAQEQATPQQQIQQLQQQMQQQMVLRGACARELSGYLERAGELVTFSQVLRTFEAANPGKTLSPEFVVTNKEAK